MLKRIGFTVITLVVAGVCSADLHAQTLQTGTWTGTAVGPDGSSDDVAFGVRTLWWAPDGRRVVFVPDGSQLPGSQLSITYYSAQGQIRLRNIQLEGDTLSYSFTIGGLDVSCALTRQEDGSYTGPCGVGGGQGGRHTMHPPTG